MDFLRKLLKYLFLSKTEEPVHPDSTQEIIPAEPPVAPPDIDPAAEPIKEIAEQVVSTPTIDTDTDTDTEEIPKPPVVETPTLSFIPLLEKALDKTFNEQQKKAVESIQQALTELDIREQRFIAYIYATAWHESKLKPVKERRAKLNTRLRTLQDRYWESGYYGRGFVQITWEHNYAKFADLLNIHLLEEPDLALQADIAAKILCLGMRDGLFTGLKLSHFFNDERTDWIKARRIVNGDDQAERIAQYGEHIFNALESGNDDEAM